MSWMRLCTGGVLLPVSRMRLCAGGVSLPPLCIRGVGGHALRVGRNAGGDARCTGACVMALWIAARGVWGVLCT